MIQSELIWLLLKDAFWSGMASTGFAILFNVPPRMVVGCALCGALGHVVRTWLMQIGFSIEAATLVGATAVGFLGEFFSRRWDAPVPIFTVSGVIPLVPGSFAFSAMINLIQFADTGPTANTALFLEATYNFIKTALVLGAIAFGIAAPTLLFQRRQPMI